MSNLSNLCTMCVITDTLPSIGNVRFGSNPEGNDQYSPVVVSMVRIILDANCNGCVPIISI